MTEAIDNEFIPLAIFNNKKGKNLDLLKKHKEPTWNNPTVRIVNINGENIVNRLASNYSSIAPYSAMINALESSGNSITKYFKMYSFWKGGKELDAQNGVHSTKAGFLENIEVVRVIYDTDKISHKELQGFATKHKLTSVNFIEYCA
jgi:hypothetical protein